MRTPRTKKRFGQHFLTDPGVIDAIVRAIAPQPEDVVVEIGPGPGAITVPLMKRAAHLHAIELDRDLASRLKTRFVDDGRITIHQADALDFDLASIGTSLRVVGNLPYNVSTPLLFHLLEQRDAIADMHFMLQKEVVDRIAAAPGGKAYGRLTIMLGCYFEVEALFDVDRLAFEPPPAVMSAVVRLRPRPAEAIDLNDAAALSTLLATAFSQRRKTLRNALKTAVEPHDLEASGIDASLRPENLAIADWVRLANRLAAGTDKRD